MMTPTQRAQYRRTLAWIGFVTAYAVIPLALATGIYFLDGHLSTTHYDRAQFLSEAHTRP